MKKIFSVILSSLTILTCLSGCGNSLKNVIFNNTVVTYDGKMHSIEASNLPSGVSVRYENNSFKDAGEYLVKVIFTKENKDLKTKEVKLTINPRNVTVNIDDKQSMIDDIEELTYTVEGLIEGDDLGISLSVDPSSSGKKQIIGSWDNDNYQVTFNGGKYVISEYLFDSSYLTNYASEFLPNYAPFSLYDTSFFKNSVITSISFPYFGLVSGVDINSKDLYMPVYVVKSDFSTKQSDCTIENGKKVNLDFTGKLNGVNKGDWLTVDNLNIVVESGETLAFGDPDMKVLPMFLRNNTTYGFYNRIFTSKGNNNHSLIFKIAGYNNTSSDETEFVEDEIDYISFMGDSISTYEGISNNTSYNDTIGSNAVWYPNTNYSGANMDVSDTWWHQTAEELDYDICVNNSWSGSVVNTSQTYNVRAKNLHNKTNNAPDVIVMLMGVNDYAEGTVVGDYDGTTIAPRTPSNFSEAYGRTVSNMKETYPQAEIFCCTFLPDRKRFTSNTNSKGYKDEDYNNAIRTIAKNLDVNLIDLFLLSEINSSNITTYTVDKLHPNANGMDLITKCVVAQINKVMN